MGEWFLSRDPRQSALSIGLAEIEVDTIVDDVSAHREPG